MVGWVTMGKGGFLPQQGQRLLAPTAEHPEHPHLRRAGSTRAQDEETPTRIAPFLRAPLGLQHVPFQKSFIHFPGKADTPINSSLPVQNLPRRESWCQPGCSEQGRTKHSSGINDSTMPSTIHLVLAKLIFHSFLTGGQEAAGLGGWPQMREEGTQVLCSCQGP